MTWSSGVEELVQLAPEIREDIWVGSNVYYTADTPVAREVVKSYQPKFGGPPGYARAAAYGMTRMMLHAPQDFAAGHRAGARDARQLLLPRMA